MIEKISDRYLSSKELEELNRKSRIEGYHKDWLGQLVGARLEDQSLTPEEKSAYIRGTFGRASRDTWPFKRLETAEKLSGGLNPSLMFSGGVYFFDKEKFKGEALNSFTEEFLTVEDWNGSQYRVTVSTEVNRPFSFSSENYSYLILPWANFSDWVALGSTTVDSIPYGDLPVIWEESKVTGISKDLVVDKPPAHNPLWKPLSDISSTFNGVRKKFKLSETIRDKFSLLVIVGGVPQHPSHFIVSPDGEYIEFDFAPSRKYNSAIYQLISNDETPVKITEVIGDEIRLDRDTGDLDILVSISGEFIFPSLYAVHSDKVILPAAIPEYLEVCVWGVHAKEFFYLGETDGSGDTFNIGYPLITNKSNLLIFVDEVFQFEKDSYSSSALDNSISFRVPPRAGSLVWGMVKDIDLEIDEFTFDKSNIETLKGSLPDHIGKNFWGMHPSAGVYDAAHYALDVNSVNGFLEEDLSLPSILREFPSEVTSVTYKNVETSAQVIDTDVALLEILGKDILITPKSNWLVSGVNQVREMIVTLDTGERLRSTLNPIKEQNYSFTS